MRTSQLEALKRQPMNEAVFVHLDRGELTGSTGMTPVPDICDGEFVVHTSSSARWDEVFGLKCYLSTSCVQQYGSLGSSPKRLMPVCDT